MRFFNYLQRVFFRNSKVQVEMRPMTRHTSLVTFMELNLILWTNYMVLLFCYDDNFIGDRHPITALVAFGCLVGSLFMFRRLINISQWGYALRFSIATVVVFWTFVEVMGRWNAFHEIWVEPMTYQSEMITIFLAFIVLVTFLWYKSIKIRKHYNLSSAPLFIFMQISRRGCSKVRFEAFTKIKRVIHSYFISYFTYIVYTLLQKFHSPFHTKDTHIFIRCISGHSFYFPKKAARLTPTADAKSSIVNSGLSNCFSKIVCNFSPNFLSSSVEHKA